MRINRLRAIACGALLLAAWVPAPSLAGTLQVNPVLVEVNAGRRTATVTVRNQEATPVTIRAYPLAWTQTDGEDIYEESSALIVSPPIFTIAPGATQMVRIGLRTPSAAPQAFRLIIEEVPEANDGGGIRVALRLNLPFYSMMAPGAPADLRWSASRRADGGWNVEAVNGGPGYVRLDAAMAQAATGLEFGDHVNFGTILPGATRRWQTGAEVAVRDRTRLDRVAGIDRDAAAAASRD